MARVWTELVSECDAQGVRHPRDAEGQAVWGNVLSNHLNVQFGL